jgi:hypothetical protein
MSAGFRSFSSFWWGPDGLGRPTKTYPSDILLQKVGIENSAPNDILIANKDIESGIVGDILLKKLNVYSELGFDILQKRLVESSLLEDIAILLCGGATVSCGVGISNKNKAISWSGGVVVRREFPYAILEADIFTLKTRAIGYGMIYHIKISDIEKSYYNSIGISKRAIKLKARKPPYERKIVESSVVSIGVRDVDDELEKQSREYPEDVEPEREKSKVSIEDYNDLL